MTLAVLVGVFARDVAATTHILPLVPPRVTSSPPFSELYVTAQVHNHSVSHCGEKAARPASKSGSKSHMVVTGSTISCPDGAKDGSAS